MRKIIIFLFVFLSLSSVQAADYKLADLDLTCFEFETPIDHSGRGTFKASLPLGFPGIFAQDGQILDYKLFEAGRDEYVEYEIIEIGGKEHRPLPINAINDNNSATGHRYDTLSGSSIDLIIDARRTLKAGEFKINLLYSGAYRPEYFVSQDRLEFKKVDRPEHFDFRFLKVEFVKRYNDGKAYPLFVSELNVITKGRSVYLVNSMDEGQVNIYSGYRCESDIFDKAARENIFNSQKAAYSIDINTPVYTVQLVDNPAYNFDMDGDGINNDEDNCPFVKNELQEDSDRDGLGDACDLDNSVKNFFEKDSDGDGIGDSKDNCPFVFNPMQKDMNADGIGDLCADDDKDGIIGYKDNCVYIANSDQKDINANGIGDACEFDKDGDGIFDSIDNCISVYNPGQEDADKDGIGDACDNCELYNPAQIDRNGNGLGDVCEEAEESKKKNDKDNDGILDFSDNCPEVSNPEQEDADKDGVGDVCDNCPNIKNPDQADENENSVGDMCEDIDGDGYLGYLDNCPAIPNPDQKDSDNNGVGDVCEDKDRDGVLAFYDNCPYDYNPDQSDIDKDGIGDVCDDKDDRAIESNSSIFKAFIVIVALVFLGLILFMFKKMRSESSGVEGDELDEEKE